jgi:hypothetical protein
MIVLLFFYILVTSRIYSGEDKIVLLKTSETFKKNPSRSKPNLMRTATLVNNSIFINNHLSINISDKEQYFVETDDNIQTYQDFFYFLLKNISLALHINKIFFRQLEIKC